MTVPMHAGLAVLLAAISGCGPWLSTPLPTPVSEPAAQELGPRRDGRPHAADREIGELARWIRPHTRHWSDLDRRRLADDILVAARSYGLDPLLVAAVIERESHYRTEVVSFAGAVGLMQILPWVAEDLAARHGVPWEGPDTLRDPSRNIWLGTAYLRELMEQFGDVALALAAYNMGPTLLRARMAQGFVPRGPYVRGVLAAWRGLEQQRAYERDFVRRTQRRFDAS